MLFRSYYSLSGNTERVAEDLAAKLGADLEKIGDDKNRRGWWGYLRAALDSIREQPAEISGAAKAVGNYHLTVVGTPIWAGKITPAIRTYLRSIHDRSNDIAFFTTSGSTPIGNVLPAMERLAGRQAVASAGFDYTDLKTAARYDSKLEAFMASLQRGRGRDDKAGELHHAAA